jgi:hypothetical protein
MDLDRKYEQLGDPDEPYELTKKDHRRQAERERWKVQITASVAEAREQTRAANVERGIDPDTPPAGVVAAWEVFRQSREHLRQHPEDLVVWRLRRYCGHVTEQTAHHTHTTVHAATSGSSACAECGMDPSVIVAAKALRRQDPLPGVKAPKPKRPTQAEQIAALRAENAELRRQLES